MFSLLNGIENAAKETLSPMQLGEQVFTNLPAVSPARKSLFVRPTPKVYHIPTIGEAFMDASAPAFKATLREYPFVADPQWQKAWYGKFFHEHAAFRKELRKEANRGPREDGRGDGMMSALSDQNQVAIRDTSVFFPSGQFGNFKGNFQRNFFFNTFVERLKMVYFVKREGSIYMMIVRLHTFICRFI